MEKRSMQLQDKVALITGAGSGIGQVMAILFAKEGARVVIADLEPSHGEETLVTIRRNQGEAVFVEGDVSNAGHARLMVQAAVANYSRLDILVNSAGVLLMGTVQQVCNSCHDCSRRRCHPECGIHGRSWGRVSSHCL
jgi:enoyl-[acyl-carrier-protein] reductase (NADH)